MDEKIKLKEEQEQFKVCASNQVLVSLWLLKSYLKANASCKWFIHVKVELKAMREAAQWRRSQGT